MRDFEVVQMGLSVAKPELWKCCRVGQDGKVIIEEHKKGEKRKFELDEEELIQIAKEDREKAKKALTEEKVLLCESTDMRLPLQKEELRIFGFHR